MSVVFVHGNPETDAIWDALVARLERDDVVLLSPPGFGAPVPDGFGATVTDYRAWLIAELEALETPVDLVGHDWGGGHVVNVAMTRPDLLRSWATDAIGVYDPDYVWHDMARGWRTPGRGEAMIARAMGGTIEERTARALRMVGRPEVAARLAEAQGPEMGRCVLDLYRSASEPVLQEMARDLPVAATRPGLQITATDDTYVGTADMRRRTAERANAQVVELPGLGHWWMLQEPRRAAEVLTDFWAQLPC
ncbi:alpha/beta fold hydrolase [Streptantibioticus silvisoli]|uniref:Alpha/beta hydrolase n=1 Tax=Streptantibioticus silvisoli TaxID=2705255 RepID=A0ABT6VX10_9ACTN|nr:alpha/beta hydrolase [Streptantibioticus silvisoli]MDI5963029.1 alpha/beta hydrolase [Streptantibioticus silvisoli]